VKKTEPPGEQSSPTVSEPLVNEGLSGLNVDVLARSIIAAENRGYCDGYHDSLRLILIVAWLSFAIAILIVGKEGT
jgi:hypothetical protein